MRNSELNETVLCDLHRPDENVARRRAPLFRTKTTYKTVKYIASSRIFVGFQSNRQIGDLSRSSLMRENGPYPVARQTSAVSRGDAGVRRLADGYPGTAR